MGRLHRHFSPPAMLKAVKLDASKHVIPKGSPYEANVMAGERR